MAEPTVLHLLTASASGEPMVEHDEARLIAGRGIEGDRYLTGEGHWSDPRWQDQQLTLVEAELGDELGLDPRLLRRNIVTRGMDLTALIGCEFMIGGARLRGVRACDPCRYIETQTRPGLFDALAGRGGVRAEVLDGGLIRRGDTITVLNVAPTG